MSKRKRKKKMKTRSPVAKAMHKLTRSATHRSAKDYRRKPKHSKKDSE